MKIKIKHNENRSFSVKFPNWLVLGRLGIGFAARSIVKQNGGAVINVKIGGGDDEKSHTPLGKREYKAAVKRVKRTLMGARGELRAFLKQHPNFVFVDVVSEDGEQVKISF